MSYQTIRRAYEIAGLNKGERAVLVALALHADERDRAFPGQKLLSRYTCYSVRSVQRAIDGLEARGLISRSYRTTAAGLRTSDLYHLHLSGDTMSGDTMSSELAPPAETSGDMTSMPTRHGVAQTAREVPENLHRWDDDFELFYAEYPKRVDRAESKAAWARVMARGIAPEYVIRAARRYAELKEERYAEKSARWLEGDWWPPLAAEWLRDDVRAAKARGCLPKDAPEDVLPDAARGCLEDARARWRAENVERGA